ncbi:hypothetical protein COLO4_06460 [Corchorus olitorius]|uniref:Uncharacterized protein n=1 Tax=Corchorus olitorius TaxID=93759 RepID=A0A1R3KN81_9ROSI|nr:hypothetical protein COLO4_06460 [Corchorus olitorius]
MSVSLGAKTVLRTTKHSCVISLQGVYVVELAPITVCHVCCAENIYAD